MKGGECGEQLMREKGERERKGEISFPFSRRLLFFFSSRFVRAAPQTDGERGLLPLFHSVLSIFFSDRHDKTDVKVFSQTQEN